MKMNLLVALSLGITLSLNAQNKVLNTAQNTFGIELLHQIDNESAHRNWFFSAFSAHTALSMLYAGTDPKSGAKNHQEIAKTLSFGKETIESANKLYQAQLKDLQAIKSVKLMIANSVWALESYPITKEYKQTLAQYFNSEYKTFKTATSADLEQATKNINQWISDKTEKMITQALDKVPKEAFAYLINTIYFKGNWATVFDEKATQKEDFTNWNKSKKKVDMMHQVNNNLSYVENADFKAVRLPYEGNEVAMYVFLPNDIEKWTKNLDAKSLATYISNIQHSGGHIVDVKLPKFKYRFKTLLNDQLKKMGMKQAFEFSPTNFPRMTGNAAGAAFKVSQVIHEAVIEVSEKGTEAAAVTIIGVTREPNAPRIEKFYVNQPFFYVIQHEKTNTTLFAGKMETME